MFFIISNFFFKKLDTYFILMARHQSLSHVLKTLYVKKRHIYGLKCSKVNLNHLINRTRLYPNKENNLILLSYRMAPVRQVGYYLVTLTEEVVPSK